MAAALMGGGRCMLKPCLLTTVLTQSVCALRVTCAAAVGSRESVSLCRVGWVVKGLAVGAMVGIEGIVKGVQGGVCGGVHAIGGAEGM